MAGNRCDSCKTADAAGLFRSDSSPLCLKCDTNLHNNDDSTKQQQLMSRHTRVWMCEVCEQAPASVMCKVDEAALCARCDADIHSANPIVLRHERLPVELFFGCTESIVKSSPFSFLVTENVVAGYHQNDEADGVSWMLPAVHHNQNPKLHHTGVSSKVLDMENNQELKPGYQTCNLFLSCADPFLNFEDHSSLEGMFYREQNHRSGGSDSVVPVQSKQSPIDQEAFNNEMCFDIDFCRSKIPSSNHPSSQSLSHSVSSASLDVGVVPDVNSMSDIPYHFGQNMNSSSDPVSATNATNQPTQLCGMDRKARVLRYREKRKNRRFEKTIRYASRKAYAETRPRIKGRFAKRTVLGSDMDRFFHDSSSHDSSPTDAQYGVVPSF